MQITFSKPSGATTTRGPYASFRLEGEVLREKLGGPVVAIHRGHQWQVDGEHFARLDCDCGVQVHLERAGGMESESYGPFQSFSCLDGMAYTNHELFAFADRTIGDWYCHRDDHHWGVMIVEAVN